MKNWTFGILAAAIVFGVVLPSPTPGDGANGEDQIRILIKQLDDNEFATREAAQKRLIGMGSITAKLLEAAKKDSSLSQEAMARIDVILKQVRRPDAGFVWRGTPDNVVPPAGIQAGDVVVAINGQEIQKDDQSHSVLSESINKSCELTIWQQGKTNSVVATTILTEHQLHGFYAFPDCIADYLDYGHKGSWDDTVLKGFLDMYHQQNIKAHESFQKAWDKGCRDPLVLVKWADSLIYLGGGKPRQEETALNLLLEYREKNKVWGDYPYYRDMFLDELPWNLFRAYVCLGRLDDAEKTLAETLKAAKAAKNKTACGELLNAQLKLIRNKTPDKILDFIKANPDFDTKGYTAENLFVNFSEMAAAGGDPVKAMEMLAYIKDNLGHPASEEIEDIMGFYEDQAHLANNMPKDQKDAKFVLVNWLPRIYFSSSPVGHTWTDMLPAATPPFALSTKICKLASSSQCDYSDFAYQPVEKIDIFHFRSCRRVKDDFRF